MKVVLTGNPTEEYAEPLLAVAEELNQLIDEEKLADTRIYFFSTKNSYKKEFFENGISFRRIVATKNPSFLTKLITTFTMLIQLFAIFPDVVFSTGGYASRPVLLAAKILKIPVIVHSSQSIPDKIILWAAPFAEIITINYKQSFDFFSSYKDKVVHTGEPIRILFQRVSTTGAHEFLHLEEETPVLWISARGGNSFQINRVIEESLNTLLHDYQIIHETGEEDFEATKLLVEATLNDHPFRYRYHIYKKLNTLATKMTAGVSQLAVTHAGNILFKIAYWEIPSIVIPDTNTRDKYEIKNAYHYARENACIVIEENNLTDNGLIFEIKRILETPGLVQEMKEGAKNFMPKDAGKKIAKEMVKISLQHEEV